jgi:hypothetical protein
MPVGGGVWQADDAPYAGGAEKKDIAPHCLHSPEGHQVDDELGVEANHFPP